MARLVISGYYGLDNAGDEAVLAAIVQAVRRRDPNGRLTVLSADPEHTRRVHGVEAIRRTDLRAVAAELGRADLLISGGGSLLQDVTSLRSLLYYLGVMALAWLRGVPVFFYAQGIGPLRRPLSRWLVARAARGAAGVTVRDAASAELLRRIGVQRPVRVTADPVFALSGSGAPRTVEERVPEKRPVFGFAFRPWPGQARWLPEVAQAAAELVRRYGAEVRWLAFHPERDSGVVRALQEACPEPTVAVPPVSSPHEVFAQVAACDVVVAARLHALIMGAAAGRPVVGVSYDPKVDAVLETLGLAPAGTLPGVSAGALVSAAAEAWERREAVAAALAPRVAELRRLAESTAELALACARKGAEERVEVLGAGVDPVTLAEAAGRIRDWVETARRERSGRLATRQVVTLNPEMVMSTRRSRPFAHLVACADLVTADGVGVLWASRRLGRPLPERVAGVDLVTAVLAEGAAAGWSVFFLGAAPGVAEEAAAVAERRYPGIRAAGARHGYFPREEEDRVVAEVAAAAPDVLLVALGSPRQEEFIAHHREQLNAAVAIGVGGTFDVLAGRARRAPAWLRRMGLEWLYRVVRDPRRFKRVLAIPAFMWEVWRRSRR